MNDLTVTNKLSLNNSVLTNKVEKEDTSFADRLKTALTEVNEKHHNADQAIEQVMQDKMGIHEGMMAIQEADVSLRLLLQVRGKVMAAYNEVMRMQF